MLSFGEFIAEENKYTVQYKTQGTEKVQNLNISASSENAAKQMFRVSHPHATLVNIHKSGGLLHKLFGTTPHAGATKPSKDSAHYKTDHHYGYGDIDPATVPVFRPSWQSAH